MHYLTIMDIYNMLYVKYMSEDTNYSTSDKVIIRSILADIQDMYVTAFEEHDAYWATIYEKEYNES